MLENLKKIISRVLPKIDISTVTEDTKLFEDLNFDSLTIMMMSMEIEDEFGFRFTEFVKFETVGDACAYISKKIG